MVRVEFAASPFGPATSAEAAPGERLMDVCDEAAAPVPFSCRNATCGTCLVRITRGAERLDPVGSDERSVLDALAAHPASRLACRARVVAPEGTIAVSLDLGRGF